MQQLNKNNRKKNKIYDCSYPNHPKKIQIFFKIILKLKFSIESNTD